MLLAFELMLTEPRRDVRGLRALPALDFLFIQKPKRKRGAAFDGAGVAFGSCCFFATLRIAPRFFALLRYTDCARCTTVTLNYGSDDEMESS